MNEETRRTLRARCDESLYFFLKLCFGFSDMIPSLHGQFANYVQQPKKFKLIVGPRGHLKTSVCTIGYAGWRALKDPNIRILVAANTATNAQKMIRGIRGAYESNEILRELYRDVIPDRGETKWTDDELTLRRTKAWPEGTIEAIGRGGKVTSRHFDLIIEDDLLAPEDNQVITPDMVKEAIEWHKYATGLRMSHESEQVISANRWVYDDYVAYLMTNEKWFLPAMYLAAYDDQGEVRWPQRFPREELERILEQQGPRIFSAQYLNDPAHEDARSFDPSWFRYYGELPKIMNAVTAIDPAISQKKHGDYTAIVTVGADLQRNIYVLDARRNRWGIDEMINEVFEVARVWTPKKVGLETVLFQKALMWPFREAMRRHEVRLPLTELRPSSQITKEARIMALHEYFANGSLWLNKRHAELLNELRGFPAIVHDDMLDALSYAVQMLIYPSKAEEVKHWSPFSLEYIQQELRTKGQGGASPFLWGAGKKPAAVLQGPGLRVPQTPEEVFDAMQRARSA